MAKMVIIEVQNQFGKWDKFREISNNATGIKNGLQAALKSSKGKRSGKARAIDKDTKSVIDMAMG